MRAWTPALCLALLSTPPAAAADDPDPNLAEGTVGSHGGLVRMVSGTTVGLLPGSARAGAGRHRIRIAQSEPLLPPPEGVGPRVIDRRSASPLGLVEGPPVAVGGGLQISVLDPDPSEPVAPAVEQAEEWSRWLDSVPDRVMPYVDPAREGQRKGLVLAVPDAAPEGTAEEVSVWLRAPGGLRRGGEPERIGAPRPGEDGIQRWDPCLVIGRIDGTGTAWFYLPEASCGLDPSPVWTPLREQSQGEFAAWVLDQIPSDQARSARKELKAMAKDETKREKEE